METKKEELTFAEAIERAGGAIHRFPLIKVRGVPLMEHIAKNWSSIWAFRPDPSDLLISTYPKAGTTWTQEIVDLLLNNGDADVSKRAPIPVRIPFLEIFSPPPIPSGLDLLQDMDPPRVIKTHLPIQLVPEGFWDSKCKVIYVARNAKDNLVSYYHFDRMNLTQPEPGPWDGYIHKFMKGDLGWGSWYDHVKGYWKEREKRNILYLFYEDMKENPRREIIRIMEYLDLSLSVDTIDHIVQLTSFKVMKDNPMANYSFIPMPVFDQSVSPFMRKGEVGDWANHFTPEQAEMFDEDYARQMEEVDIPFRSNI
ncbi:sulfotransferase 1C2 isoform X1 [Clupea harengus]|uniref:Sulfotransferase n=1 Tax=Clupea harengus TaxID=7950 RepID=A0A6P8EW24_CLUHA|nr:sulfotransferase 1C2 isoform X1 [Clupea harengus]XP_031416445.1 sulfotransferase 1C2 isoform X1 [Clupea harengus]